MVFYHFIRKWALIVEVIVIIYLCINSLFQFKDSIDASDT